MPVDGARSNVPKKTLDHSSFKPDVSVVITELGIEKSRELGYSEKDLLVIDRLTRRYRRAQRSATGSENESILEKAE